MVLNIDGLTAEHRVQPIGIDQAAPRLSWYMRDSRRSIVQSACQVLVASTVEALNAGKGDLWDSGKTANGDNRLTYAGSALKSRQICWWKVRVWDQGGLASDWSAPSRWEMGLLRPSDWKATWIGRTTETDYRPAPLLRREFTVRRGLARARIYVCGLAYCDLAVNGRRPDDRLLDPGYTRFDRRVLYVTHDVTALLREGQNALAVMLGTGWLNVHSEAVWGFHKAPWRQAPKLLLQLHLDYQEGTSEIVLSDASWKTTTGPIIYDSIYGGETYDARLEKPGWELAGYDDRDWQAAIPVTAPGGVVTAQNSHPLRCTKEFVPKAISSPKPGISLIDFGQNFAGHVRLNLDGAIPGSEITMRYGERVDAEGLLTTAKTGEHMNKTAPPQRFQTDRYVCKGGAEHWEPRFTYHGGDRLEISGWPRSAGELKTANIRCRVHHDGWERRGNFSCSNELLNKIYDATLWSYRSNMQSIPTDCPHREKNGWTGDAHLACEQGLLNFDSATSYEKWLDDLADEQKDDGSLPGIVPTCGWGYEWGNGPAWDSAYHLIAWYLYLYTGDHGALARHYDRLKRYVDYLTSRAKDGLIDFGLGDWLPVDQMSPVALTSTGYYYVDTVIVAKAARLIGKADDAAKYERLAETIKRDFNKAFLDPNSGSYAEGLQTSLSCALYQGLFDPALKAQTVQHLVEAVEKKNKHIDCGILGAKYVLRALSENGRTDLAYAIATQRDFPGWGHWFAQGATTLWEDWKGEASLNHVMFGDIVAWMYKYLAGIELDEGHPGFSRIIVKPHAVGDLTWAQAEHDSPRGRIAVSWRKHPDRFTLDVTVPVNATAQIHLPVTDPTRVREGKVPVTEAQGVRLRRVEEPRGCDGKRAVYEVGSGIYRFEASTSGAEGMAASSR